MEKKPFVTKEELEKIIKTYPTPFHLYDEKGIRENAKRLKEAFAWNKGYKEYFAVKATPNPYILQILKDYGCGTDCSSATELMMSDACGFSGHDIMFSSNDTPLQEFKLANDLGAIINLDDITHIACVEQVLGGIPKTISCRYNPGGVFKISNDIMDNPGDAKYGMTTEQIFEAYKILKAKGAEEFGIHAFLASNTVTNEYYPMLSKICLNWRFVCRKRRVPILNLSISPVVLVSRIARIRNRMILWSSAKVCVRHMKKCWFRLAWTMWQSIRNWAVSCWHHTAVW